MLKMLIVVAGFAAAPCLGAQQMATLGSRGFPELETVGTGERRVAPDRAVVHLTVISKAMSAAAAASANTRAVQAVKDTLKRIGLDSAVTTASYNVGPDYDRSVSRDNTRPLGYAARTVIRIRLTKLDQVGRVIDAALGKGATGVDGVQFESSASDDARRSALAEASIAARRDAEALAAALGGRVGMLVSASTLGGDDARRSNVMMRAAAGSLMGGTQIRPDEIVFTAAVATRWEFIVLPRQ